MERDAIFSHAVLDIGLFYCNMMTPSGSNLQIEGHNEVIDFKVIPNYHFVPSQFINDDIVLKNSFSTESLSQFCNHIPDKIHFSYDPHEISVFSMNALQTSCHFQHNFYDPIFDWLEESFVKRFPRNPSFFVHKKIDLICPMFPFEALRFQILIHNLFSFAGFKLHNWLHWKFDYP